MRQNKGEKKMKEIKRYGVEMPDYSLSYLVNGDASGLEDEDVKNIDGFMEQFYREAENIGGQVIFDTIEEEGHFTHSPEFGLACHCVDSVILIVK
jgi:hypothetical protein